MPCYGHHPVDRCKHGQPSDAPALLTHPGDYTPGGETLEIAYTGLASHPLFSTTGLSFALGLLLLSELFVDLKVTNPNGFEQGTYTAKTVLTCS